MSEEIQFVMFAIVAALGLVALIAVEGIGVAQEVEAIPDLNQKGPQALSLRER